MKKIIIVFCLLAFLSCKTKKSITETNETAVKSVKIINSNDVDSKVSDKALNLGTRLLETCNTSKFKPFNSDEATQSVIQKSTLKNISETCKKINFRNGKFISLDLIEIKHDEINNQYIFKYDINYEKKYFKRELTVFINSENKVSSMSTKEIKPKMM